MDDQRDLFSWHRLPGIFFWILRFGYLLQSLEFWQEISRSMGGTYAQWIPPYPKMAHARAPQSIEHHHPDPLAYPFG